MAVAMMRRTRGGGEDEERFVCCGLAFLKFYFFLSEEEVTAGLSGGGRCRESSRLQSEREWVERLCERVVTGLLILAEGTKGGRSCLPVVTA